jgi:hypothetical protein
MEVLWNCLTRGHRCIVTVCRPWSPHYVPPGGEGTSFGFITRPHYFILTALSWKSAGASHPGACLPSP